jgi:hypothetical protein
MSEEGNPHETNKKKISQNVHKGITPQYENNTAHET